MPERKTDFEIDLERPSVARVYDYFLGGETNWAVDRAFGAAVLADFPGVRDIARANRLFLHRVVRHLVRQGVRQIIDLGAGLPTMGSTHQVADEAGPGVRVVYADHEPVAVAHSQLLLDEHGDPERHAAVHADLRCPDRLWRDVLDTGLITSEEPVALLLVAVLHIQQPGPSGADIAPEAVARYRTLLPPGSFLALSHLTDEGVPGELRPRLAELKRRYDTSSSPVIWRSRTAIEAFLGDFAPLPPGMCWASQWYPDNPCVSGDLSTADNPSTPAFPSPGHCAIWCGVGRKNTA